MASVNPPKRILREFPPEEPEAWQKAAIELLGERAFEELLRRRTAEGIPLLPLYRREDLEGLPFQSSAPGFGPFVRGNQLYREQGWWIAQELTEHESLGDLDATTLQALREREIINLSLTLASRRGNSSLSVDELDTILGGAETASTPVFIDAGALSLQPLAVLGAYFARHGLKPDQWQGAIASDPLGAAARDGELPHSLSRSFDELAATTLWCAKNAPQLQTLWCHGEVWHDGGAHAAQELGLCMAAVVASLRELEARGVEVSTAAAHLRLSFALGPKFFSEIAKLRAARLLLFKVLQSCGVAQQNCHAPLHARSSRRSLTRYEPHMNLLRTTTEAFSAAVGGVDSLHVDAYDASLLRESRSSRRLARNLQYILQDEALIGTVMDPGGGSYYLERMTAELAFESWRILQSIEEEGGLEHALRKGTVQEMIAASAKESARRADLGQLVRIGINKYPVESSAREHPDASEQESPSTVKRATASTQRDPERIRAAETALARAASWEGSAMRAVDAEKLTAAALSAATARLNFSELSIVLSRGDKADNFSVEAIPLRREAAPFEEFRESVERARAAGMPLRVHPVDLGPAATRASRLEFALSFFRVGGFELSSAPAGADADESLQTAEKSGGGILLLCGIDQKNLEHAMSLARKWKLREELAAVVAELTDSQLKKQLDGAGIDLVLDPESPILASLQPLAARLGVRS